MSRERKAGGRRQQAGAMLIELMITMVVLTVGLLGGLALISTAIASNNRNKLDSTGTLLAQSVLEQITARGATSAATFTISDCAGAGHVIDPSGSATGRGAVLTAGGDIDFTLAPTPATNYEMSYTVCNAAGQTAVYDVRWNVTSWTSGGTTTYTKVVRVAARPTGAATPERNSLVYFAVPVTLKGIVGY